MTGLIETAARIGEMLSLDLEDYQPEQGQIVIRKAKGDEPRITPISQAWIDVVEAYVRVRPKGVDTNRLFVSEYGEALSVEMFGKQFRGYLRYAGLSGFTLHGLRHYSITQLAKTDVWAASQIAGHKDLKITRQYLHGDPAHVRAVHEQAAPLARIIVNARSQRQKKHKVV
jgi:integrase